MTDRFLSRLREIREKYGISESEYQKAETINAESLMPARKSTIQHPVSYQAPVSAYRAKNNMKRSFHQSSNDPREDIYDQLNRKRLMNEEAVNRIQISEGTSLRSSSLMANRVGQRASSQTKIPLGNYNTIDREAVQKVGLKYGNQQEIGKYSSTPYSTANIQNLKILYEPLAKPVQNIPSFTYTRQQTHKDPNAWSIDKLSHVQDKIKAFLRK